jgi:hypothetical protein
VKKFASIVASAAMIGGGLLAAAPTATAVPTGVCEYPGCIDVTANADNLNNPRVGGNARVKLNVRPEVDGNQELRGRVTFSYVRKSNDTVVAEFRRLYRGPGRTNYAFSGLPKGRYTVKVFFNSRPDSSVYGNDSDRFSQRVRPRR